MAEGEGGKGGRGLGGLIKRIVMGLIAILVIAAVGGGAYWYFFMRKADERVARTGGREGRQAVDTGPELIEHTQCLDLGSFTVNLAEGRRYLKTSIELLVSAEKAKEYLSTLRAIFDDLIDRGTEGSRSFLRTLHVYRGKQQTVAQVLRDRSEAIGGFLRVLDQVGRLE